MLEQGEELKYIVYFGFIKLGEVKLRMTQIDNSEGKKECFAKADIKSYDGVPFVSLNNIFESEMEYVKEQLYSKKFYASEFKGKDIQKTDYRFNYDSNKVKVIKEMNNKIERNDYVTFNKGIKYQDGLSIFYSARLNSFANKNYNIPIFINESQSSVKYSFNINKDVVSIGSVDYDISVIKVAGVADFTGIFGLTGEFVGWFSDDEYRVPIKAQLNVIIDSITGGVAWIASMSLAGYFFGQIPIVKNNFEKVIILVIVLSVLPIIIGYFKERKKKKAEAAS